MTAFWSVTLRRCGKSFNSFPEVYPLGLANQLDEMQAFEPTWDNEQQPCSRPVPPRRWCLEPFRSSVATSQFLAETRAKHHALLQKLAVFPESQVALPLLMYCLGAQKVNHLLRVLWSPDTKKPSTISTQLLTAFWAVASLTQSGVNVAFQ